MQNVSGKGNFRCKAPGKYSVAKTLWMKENKGRRWSWGGWQGLDHRDLVHLGRALNFPQRKFIFSPMCLYIVLSRWTYGYLFYTMRYNPVWLYFVAKNLTFGSSFSWLLSLFDIPLLSGFFLSTFLLFGMLQARFFIPRAKEGHWIYPIYLHLAALYDKLSVTNPFESFFSWWPLPLQSNQSNLMTAAIHLFTVQAFP